MSRTVHILDFEGPDSLSAFLRGWELTPEDKPTAPASPPSVATDRSLLRVHGLEEAEWRAARRSAHELDLRFRTDRDPAAAERFCLTLFGGHDRFAAWGDSLSGAAPQLATEVRSIVAAHGRTRWTWRLRGRELSVGQRTLVMGVLNVTPDSFSDGGRYLRLDDAVAHGLRLVAEGADLLDVGGESTRPGSAPVSPAEEGERVIPVIRALARRCDVPISVDTSRAEVAEASLAAGARAVNDVTALGGDPRMAGVVAASGAGVVLMHMRGIPETMQTEPHYDDLHREVLDVLRGGMDRAAAAGCDPEQVVVDPGIGFGKRLPHNLSLVRHAGTYRALGRPVLVGASRKSFLGELTGRPAEDRLAASLAAAAAAVGAGASIVRVHDVVETIDALRTFEAIRQEGDA